MRFRQVHLDFHTSEKISDIGSRFDAEQFKSALKKGHVDSITLFAKCHHGWMYYPAKTGSMHPNLDFDLLSAQIEAAHSIGVKTPIYLSVGFDEHIARLHPEWLFENKEHTLSGAESFDVPQYHLLCINTPYLDYILEQIREVCQRYTDIDSIFLDIINVRSCYCPNCIRTLLNEGKDPCNDNDALELAERVYADYVNKVRLTLDSVRPGIHVFHNGGHIRHGRHDLAYANSHLELESLPTGGWGYDHFPMSAAYVRGLGLDYLGMTGKFHTTWGEFGGFKHPNALRYETSLNIACGAKCSIGDQLAPDGHFDESTYNLIGQAYSEVEKKEEWLDNVTSVADIALFSNEAYNNLKPIGQTGAALSNSDTGAARILLEGKYLFDVIDIDADFSKYKLIILADNIVLLPSMYQKFDAFVKNGGKILASGISALNPDNSFRYDLGAKWIGKSDFKPAYIRPLFKYDNVDDTDYVVYSGANKVECTGIEFAKFIKPYFNRTKEHFCSHYHTPSSGEYGGCGMSMGENGIYIACDIFEDYAVKGNLIYKQIVRFAIDTLLQDSIALKTDLPSQGIVTLMHQSSRYILHLLYAVPTKRGENIEIIEDIIPVHNVKVSLRLPEEINYIYLAPQMTPIPFDKKDGVLNMVIPDIDCHQMVILEK